MTICVKVGKSCATAASVVNAVWVVTKYVDEIMRVRNTKYLYKTFLLTTIYASPIVSTLYTSKFSRIESKHVYRSLRKSTTCKI